MATSIDDSSTVVAAELALGLLDGAERAEAQRRVLADPDFALTVDGWRVRFADLFAYWPDQAAPATAWSRIVAAIDDGGLGVAALSSRAVALWRGAALAAALVAASLLVVVVARTPSKLVPAPTPASSSAPALVAVIAPTGGDGAPIAALYDPGAGTLRLAGVVAMAGDHDAELWVIPVDGKPRSLGLLAHDRATALVVGRTLRADLARGAQLAVSREPLGGSPTGQPTGAVVAAGTLTRI
ncbi:anti-sigma factor domain-containing protein [uncultured Sphingomonas sp.]|uniref:anti-sigma factor n=1 Tax=uncultured Sphingomonas sp. TaxID=158754 RepID=UPI0035CB8A1B